MAGLYCSRTRECRWLSLASITTVELLRIVAWGDVPPYARTRREIPGMIQEYWK